MRVGIFIFVFFVCASFYFSLLDNSWAASLCDDNSPICPTATPIPGPCDMPSKGAIPIGCFCEVDKNGYGDMLCATNYCVPDYPGSYFGTCGYPPPPRYAITGYIWIDTDRSGGRDSGESYYTGNLTVSLSGAGSATTDSISGTPGPYGFFNYLAGNYTVSITPPSGYVATTATSRGVTLGPDRYNINFGIVPVYSITGSVFNDVDRDYFKDSNEGKNWSAGVSFSTTGGNLSTDSGSSIFSITNLYAGTYTVRLTSGVPTGFINRHPSNGPPPAFLVTVGRGCGFLPLHPNTAGRATCNGRGDLSNLNYVITNSIPWYQTYGFDVRIDTGITNIIPAAPAYPPYASIIDTLN